MEKFQVEEGLLPVDANTLLTLSGMETILNPYSQPTVPSLISQTPRKNVSKETDSTTRLADQAFNANGKHTYSNVSFHRG